MGSKNIPVIKLSFFANVTAIQVQLVFLALLKGQRRTGRSWYFIIIIILRFVT